MKFLKSIVIQVIFVKKIIIFLGLIRLVENIKPLDLLKYNPPYNLTVIARDDASCCKDAIRNLHQNEAHVYITIEDVNNNKPEFPHCSEYSNQAKVLEGQYRGGNGTIIIKAEATDEDSGMNGDVIYSLYYGRSETRKPFVIDAVTGELRPSAYFVFDRETKAYEEVTIKVSLITKEITFFRLLIEENVL